MAIFSHETIIFKKKVLSLQKIMMKPMNYQKNDYSGKRVIDFNPQICGLQDDGILVFSPLDLMEGNNLFLPEGIRMPNGEISDKISFDDWSFFVTLSHWQNGPVTLYAGRNYAVNYYYWVTGQIKDYEKDNALYYPNVNYICLYEDVYEFNEIGDKTIRISSKNGILYCDDEVAFVPDRNTYAENLPLEPMHGSYKEEFCDLDNYSLEGYGRDLFGGIYSLDGKRFLRYSGYSLRKSYRVRDGVEEIYDKAFWVVTGLGNGDHGLSMNTIELPQSVKRIGKQAFRACSLRNIVLPDDITIIEEETFLNSQSLESVTLPKNLQKIEDSAFEGCGIKTVFIPKGVESIGVGCFNRCFQLSTIDVEEGNRYYSSEDGVLFNYDKSSLIRVPTSLYADSPDNANERKDAAPWHWVDCKCEKDDIVQFNNLYEGVTYKIVEDQNTGKKYKEIISKEGVHLFPSVNLVHLCLPEGSRVYVDDGEQVKAGTLICSHQESDYPDDWRIFYGYTRKRYSIPESVTQIEPMALDWCPIKELYIPKSVKSIGENALIDNDFDIIKVSPENLYFETKGQCLIDKAESAVICSFGNDIIIPEGVEKIKKYAFSSCKTSDLVIPEGVTYIEDYAFWCVRARRIVLPSTICYLEPQAFRGMPDCAIREDWDDYLKITVPKGLKDKYVKMLDGSEFYDRNFVEDTGGENESEIIDTSIWASMAKISEEDQTDSIVAEDGAKYSKDGKLLLNFGENYEYDNCSVREGTEIICDNADTKYCGIIRLPSSIKYLGYNPISTYNLIFEGTDAHFAPESLSFSDDDFIYIPFGTWARYRSRLEKAKIHDEEEDETPSWWDKYNDYHLIELSKSNVIRDLREQKSVLTRILGQQKTLDVYSFNRLNGQEGKDVVCFRISDQLRYFVKNDRCFTKYFYYLLALGYTLEKVSEILGAQIDTIEVNDNIDTAIGYQLAARVLKKWNEDFVDEDNGEVITLERSEVFIEAGEYITEDNLELIKESGAQKIYVYHDSRQSDYTGFVKYFVEPEEDEWKYLYLELYKQDREAALQAVIKEIFPSKNPDDVTEKEKDDFAYNIVTVIKGMYDFQYCLSEVVLPFRYKADDVHQEMTEEEHLLHRLIGYFYDKMIKSVSDCKSDLEVMKVFKVKTEIQSDLMSYLESNGISSQMTKMVLEDLFEYIKDI